MSERLFTIKQVEIPRDKIPLEYALLISKNPLLGRIEGSGKAIEWTDLEIRTYQLIVAVASNASLQQRIGEIEEQLSR